MIKADQRGKLIYVEPNNFVSEKLSENFVVTGLDNIPPDSEDYCISVDLQVEVVKREACGQNVEDNIVRTLSWRPKERQLSFFGGSKLNGETTNMFTSDYINTSFNDIVTNNTNNESIGITSINIDFSSWFFPVVTINFTDVRAASLMGPEDYAHTKDGQSYAGTMFKSFFTFPYPKFTLQVKGFYGQAVSFQLAVSDFRANINSSTGNFDVTVKFIGYMYGLLTDIPMSYLLAAPYDKYAGAQYWANRRFVFDDGSPIPTFSEFTMKAAKLNEELPQYAERSQTMQEYNNIRNEMNALQDIMENYNTYIGTFNSNGRLIGDKHILFTNNNNTLEANIDIKNTLVSKIDDFNLTYSTKLPYPNKENKETTSVYNTVVLFDKLNGVVEKKTADRFGKPGYEDELKSRGWWDPIYGENGDIKLVELINKWTSEHANSNLNINPLNNTYAFLYVADGFVNEIKARIENKSAVLKKLTVRVDEFQKRTSEQIFGFQPTIGNITKMTMAHLETFMASMYSCMEAIKNGGGVSGGQRSLTSLGMNVGQTDINSSVSTDVFVPPFPLYTEQNGESRGQTPAWIGDRPLGDTMEEEVLIHGILEGVKEVKKITDQVQEALLQNTLPNIDFLPTCITDIVLKNNPYANIFKDSKSTIKIDELYAHFAVRLSNYIRNDVRKIDNIQIVEDVQNFALCEAFNFYTSHKDGDIKMLEILASPENSDTDLIVNFLTNQIQNGRSVWGGVSNTPIYKTSSTNNVIFEKIRNNELQYNWINKPNNKNNKLIPVKFDNVRSIDLSKIDDFYQTIDDNTTNYRNRNVFKIDENIDFYNNFFNTILESEAPEGVDKEKLLLNWKIDLDNYDKFYSDETTILRPLINWEKLPNIEIRENGDWLPTKFRTSNERQYSQVKNLFNNVAKDEGFFLTNNKNIKGFYGGGLTNWNTRQTIREHTQRNTPLENMAYFNILCGKASTLYGHPFFYLQNSITDEDTKIKAKALLFLHSLPIVEQSALRRLCEKIFESEKDSESILAQVPFSSLAFLGGLLWRERYYSNNGSDCFVYKQVGTGAMLSVEYKDPTIIANQQGRTPVEYLLTNDAYLRPVKNDKTNKGFTLIEDILDFDIFSLRPAIKNELIAFFEGWAVSDKAMGFRNINREYELSFISRSGMNQVMTANKLVEFIQLINNSFDKNGNRKPNSISPIMQDLFNFDNVKTDTLEDFYRNNLSSNLTTNYMKLGISKPDNAFMLECRQSTTANRLLLEFLFRGVVTLSVGKSYSLITNTPSTKINNTAVVQACKEFRSAILGFYGYSESNKKKDEQGDKRSASANIDSNLSNDMKLSTYLTLKNMYDRWLCGNNIDTWMIGSENGIYNKFVFIDSFYEPIGQKLMMNIDSIIQNLDMYNASQSLYEFLSVIYQKSNVLFLATPIYNNWQSAETIETMFTPIPYHQMNSKETDSTFVCMYAHEPSKQLDLDSVGVEYGYKNDGFDIADSNGNILPIPLSQLEVTEDGLYIPAFGVTIGKQNQNFFTNVSVSMDNPQVTEQSLLAVQEIANNNSSEPNRQFSYVGQDLYKVYSNHSYTCNVEMMGCAPILPLMYFQLNNMPMFKGAYMVKGVSHTITPGDMTTTFSGVRISKYNTPLLKEIFNINDLLSQTSDNSIVRSGELIIDDYYNGHITTDGLSPATGETVAHTDTPTFGEISNYVVWAPDMNETKFNGLTDHMKDLLLKISKTVYENTPYKVRVTSMYRANGSSTSNHRSGEAVDLQGCTKDYEEGDSLFNRNKYSAQLFDLIALTFTDEIHQLIWENTKDNGLTSYREDIVTNVVHFASIGTNLGKKDIFQAYVELDYSDTTTIKITSDEGYFPLSNMFLGTLVSLLEKPNSNITMNNFNNFRNARMTSDEHKNKLLKMKIPRPNTNSSPFSKNFWY